MNASTLGQKIEHLEAALAFFCDVAAGFRN